MRALAGRGELGHDHLVHERDVRLRVEDVSWLSLRNAPEVHLIVADQLNTYDVLVADDVVFTRDALEEFLGVAPAVTEVEPGEDDEDEIEEPAAVADESDESDVDDVDDEDEADEADNEDEDEDEGEGKR